MSTLMLPSHTLKPAGVVGAWVAKLPSSVVLIVPEMLDRLAGADGTRVTNLNVNNGYGLATPRSRLRPIRFS
jgi:hypothetical protein